MPIAFNPPPLPSPQLQPQAKNNAGSASDDRAGTADAPSRFADLLTAAAHPRPTAPESGAQRPTEAKDDAAMADKAPDASGTPATVPLWLPGMAGPAMPAVPIAPAAKSLPDCATDDGNAAVAVAAATRGPPGAASSASASPHSGRAARGVDALNDGDGKRSATTVAQQDTAQDIRNAGGWSALHYAAPVEGEAKPSPALAEGSASDGPNASTTPISNQGGGTVIALAAPSAELRTPDRVDSIVPVHVDHPVGSPAWADDVGVKLAHVVSLRHQGVELHVQPAHLGPIDIRISINGDQASVQFVAPHATTRDALENALPVLRDLLAQQGLALGDTAIGGRAQGGFASSDATRDDQAQARDAGLPVSAPSASGTLRLLDVFA
jgi:flagellar hook-length control protein FliK